MVMKTTILTFIVLSLTLCAQSKVFEEYYDEAYTIVKSMTLDQKIGQTIQLDFEGLTDGNQTSDRDAIKYALGSLLVGGNGCPDQNGNRVDFSKVQPNQQKVIFANATSEKWKKLAGRFTYTVNVTTPDGTMYKIKPLIGTDAVHGDQHIAGSVIFPHNIGLSCTHNPKNFYNVGYWTTQSMNKYGFNYAFSPTVAVSHNPQWGRFYETMGQEHDHIYEYAKAYTEGLQGTPGAFTGILGSVKHFFADGATFYGADEGNCLVNSFKAFIHHNTQGYRGSISSGIGSVMASYSAINFVPLSSGPYIKKILKGDLGFDGFIISDYSQVEKLSAQHLPTTLQLMPRNESYVTMLTAGIDMFMIPSKFSMKEYIKFVKMGLNNKTVTIQRLENAVANIISVKLALGMIDTITEGKKKEKGQNYIAPHVTTEYQDSLDAVHESLVLLKNDKVIPIKARSLEYIVLVGEKIINVESYRAKGLYELFLNYDNIGMQSGGWTGRWQGFEGNPLWQGENKKSSNATSIVDGLKNINPKFNLIHPNYTTFTDTTKISIERTKYLKGLKTLRQKMNAKNTLILSVVGESPYAEFIGDVNIPYCQNPTEYERQGCIWWKGPYSPDAQLNSLKVNFNPFDNGVISTIKDQDKNIPVVTVLLSGRPMIINDILKESSAFVSAFLPGTSGGQGIVDAIFGDYVIRPNGNKDGVNSLSFDWPSNMESLKEFPYYGADNKVPEIADPLFRVGFGLSTVERMLQN